LEKDTKYQLPKTEDPQLVSHEEGEVGGKWESRKKGERKIYSKQQTLKGVTIAMDSKIGEEKVCTDNPVRVKKVFYSEREIRKGRKRKFRGGGREKFLGSLRAGKKKKENK